MVGVHVKTHMGQQAHCAEIYQRREQYKSTSTLVERTIDGVKCRVRVARDRTEHAVLAGIQIHPEGKDPSVADRWNCECAREVCINRAREIRRGVCWGVEPDTAIGTDTHGGVVVSEEPQRWRPSYIVLQLLYYTIVRVE
jgi:hypothetical protein